MAASITGVLAADFSDFYAAVEKAEAHLVDFETDANKVERSLNRMTDSFSGKKLVQDATLAAEAIDQLGGVTKLTTNELARASAQAKEATEKLRLMGEDIPPKLQALADAVEDVGDETAAAADKTDDLNTQYKTFDDVLEAAGVNVNQQVKGLSQLKDMATQNVASMDKFTVAGAAVAAAMVGWQIGKYIDEWTGLSTAIGDATAKLLGWNSVQAGGPGSLTDTLARASAIAKREITDLGEALKVINGQIKSTQDVFLRAQAPEAAAKMVAGYHKEVRELAKSGVLDDLKNQIREGNLSQAELARLYRISGEAMQIVTNQVKAYDDAKKKDNETTAKAVQLQNQLYGRDQITKAAEYFRALEGNLANVSKLAPAMMDEVNKTTIAAVDSMRRLGEGTSTQIGKYQELIRATTDWAEVNKNITATLGPIWTASHATRMEQWRAESTAMMANAEEAGRAATVIAESHRLADEQAKQWAAEQANVTAATEAAAGAARDHTSANQSLAGSFQVVTRTAAEWREQAARLNEDARRMEQAGPSGPSITPWYSQYIANLRKGAANASSSAAYEDRISAITGGGWSGGRGMTITVNATQPLNGDQIAGELVAGMRRRGVTG